MPYQGRLPYTYKSPFNTTLDQGTQTVPSLAFLGDTNNGIFSPALDNIAITTNGSEKLRVTSTGNVGIGTTNPASKLHVLGQNNTTPVVISAGNSATFSFSGDSSSGYTANFNINDTGLTIGHNSASRDFRLQTNSLPRITITSSGNVGIGTTNPTAALVLGAGGNLQLNRSDNARSSLIFHNSNGFNINANTAGDDVTINAGNATGRVILQVNSSTTLTAHSSGVVLVGSTSTPTGTASQTLQVTGGAYVSGNVGIGTTNPQAKLDVNGNVLPTTDAAHDLGSPSKRWNNVYTTDLQLSNEGSSNDVDGTWGQYTIQEGENDLFLLNRRNGKKYKFVLQEVN